jgi:hypothetical protein
MGQDNNRIEDQIDRGLQTQVVRDGFTGEQQDEPWLGPGPLFGSPNTTVTFKRLVLGHCSFQDVNAYVTMGDSNNVFDVSDYQLTVNKQETSSTHRGIGKVTLSFNNAQQLQQQLPGENCSSQSHQVLSI